MSPIEIAIDPSIGHLIRIGAVQAEGVAIRPAAPLLDREMEDLADAFRAKYAGKPPGEGGDRALLAARLAELRNGAQRFPMRCQR